MPTRSEQRQMDQPTIDRELSPVQQRRLEKRVQLIHQLLTLARAARLLVGLLAIGTCPAEMLRRAVLVLRESGGLKSLYIEFPHHEGPEGKLALVYEEPVREERVTLTLVIEPIRVAELRPRETR